MEFSLFILSLALTVRIVLKTARALLRKLGKLANSSVFPCPDFTGGLFGKLQQKIRKSNVLIT